MKNTLQNKYYNFTVSTDSGVFDVIACDWDSAQADVREAFPFARIITTARYSEVAK